MPIFTHKWKSQDSTWFYSTLKECNEKANAKSEFELIQTNYQWPNIIKEKCYDGLKGFTFYQIVERYQITF